MLARGAASIGLYVLTTIVLMAASLPETFIKRLEELSMSSSGRVIVVDVSDQKALLFSNGEFQKEYSVSTAKNGLGQRLGTNQTPLGLHRIREKVGDGAGKGAIFESRVFVERYWPEVRGENESLQKPDTLESSDLITSRILWLEGLEPGFNSGVDAEGQVVDSYERYIYFHGTNHEDKIGTPVSKGCIRMLNTDVIELFDLVQVGDLVWIQE
jgi:hypothetical protein